MKRKMNKTEYVLGWFLSEMAHNERDNVLAKDFCESVKKWFDQFDGFEIEEKTDRD